MKVCILMGSPRKNGNTAALLKPFCDELESNGAETEVIWLHDKEINPCVACRECQKDWSAFNCIQRDDMQEIAARVLACDLLVLATPIYSWYCTAPMKAAMDRMVYGFNKIYGETRGPALWAGKPVAMIATCGYRPDQGTAVFEEGLKLYCKHSQLRYLGRFAERHRSYSIPFMDGEKEQHSREFARELLEKLSVKEE